MQLTDDEIREILRREKRKKRRKQQARRRFLLVMLVLILLIVFCVVRFFPRTEPVATEQPPRGVIFIDPGHGGDDPGSDNGARYEKEDTLRLSLAVRTYLEGEGFEVHMSRINDQSVDREQRAQMANECKAQLMISVHRNQVDGKGQGVEIFVPKSNTSESNLLARNILKALVAQGFSERKIVAGTLDDPEEDYPEIAAATMPACLVEVGFISSMDDNKIFDKKLDSNAKAMADAIVATFKTLYEPETEAPESENGKQAEDQTEEKADTGE